MYQNITAVQHNETPKFHSNSHFGTLSFMLCWSLRCHFNEAEINKNKAEKNHRRSQVETVFIMWSDEHISLNTMSHPNL